MATITTPKQTPEITPSGGQRPAGFWAVIAILAVAVIGAVAWLALSGGGVSIDDETATLEQLIADQEAAQNRFDEDAMLTILATDAVVHLNDLPAFTGREAMRQAYAGIWPVFVSTDLTITKTVVAESGETAWMYGTQVNELDLPNVGRTSVPAKWMAVWEKTEGEWMITALSIAEATGGPPT